MEENNVHQGNNIKHLRESLGLSVETIALILNISIQAALKLEQEREIEDKVLITLANALKVPVEVLKNMKNDTTTTYINTFHDCTVSGVHVVTQYNFGTTPDSQDQLADRLTSVQGMLEKILNKKQ